jgi:hypothetical protein
VPVVAMTPASSGFRSTLVWTCEIAVTAIIVVPDASQVRPTPNAITCHQRSVPLRCSAQTPVVYEGQRER